MKMDEEFIKMLKYTRFSGLLANWERYLEVAQEGNFSHVRLLKYIVEEEYRTKKENSRKLRLYGVITTDHSPEKALKCKN
ncbi:MAG TPA: hypothetical protein VK186_05175 [Candidatus Deferrimicrobium sp.]|nr:hypothetical protein [Candidatus Deferrimicrobium sp.]